MTAVIAPNFVVVTNCTGRKMTSSAPARLPPDFRAPSLQVLVKAWLRQLEECPHRQAVASLYKGRSFCDAKSVATDLGGPLYVVSAGLGLVTLEEQVPAYDITVATDGATLLPALHHLKLTTKSWWQALNEARGRPSPIASAIERHPASTWFLAMPSTYLTMIEHELASMSAEDRSRLRIFTSPAWFSRAPAELRPQVLPYDERLESSHLSGTRNDFAQRALRHFIETLAGQHLGLSEAHQSVRDAMTALTLRQPPIRTRKTDEEIRQVLRMNWNAHGGASGRLLRFLRDDARIQCEQSRFKTLWHDVRAAMEAST